MDKELLENKGIRVCCESSRGEIDALCGGASEETNVPEICNLCHSNPDTDSIIPFDIFMGHSSKTRKIKYLYGMLDCPTHSLNLTDYDWSIYKNGNLKVGDSIYNQTNYCINYGNMMDQGK